MDREVFTEPENILKYCHANKFFKSQHREERVENCALVYYMKKTLNSIYKEEANRLQGVNKRRKWSLLLKKFHSAILCRIIGSVRSRNRSEVYL